MDEELRAARIRLMNAEALSKELAAEFGKIQVEEATRNWGLEKNSAHAEHIFTFANIVRNDTVQNCMRTLDVWARQEPGCDITIVLNSPGGDAFAGFALIVLLMRLDWRRILRGKLPATSEQSRSLDDQEMGDGHVDDPGV